MNQPSLPTKTKIAAWAMIVIGIICTISLLLFLAFNILIKMTNNPYLFYDSPLVAGFLMIMLAPSIYLISPALLLLGNQTGILSFLPYLQYFLIPILFVLFGFLLLKNKMWVWWGTIIFLIIEALFVTYQLILVDPGENTFISFNPSLYVSGILFITLILDRKNYWRICSEF